MLLLPPLAAATHDSHDPPAPAAPVAACSQWVAAHLLHAAPVQVASHLQYPYGFTAAAAAAAPAAVPAAVPEVSGATTTEHVPWPAQTEGAAPV